MSAFKAIYANLKCKM